MKKIMLAMMLLAGSAFAAPRISVGIGIGVPARVAVVRPACPGPGYVWVDGYYGPSGVWLPGYWRAPVVTVAPRIVGPRYYVGHYDRDFHDRDFHDRDFHRGFRR